MARPTESFFEGLSGGGPIPGLARASGTVRFELTGGAAEHWLLHIDRGDVRVSRDDTVAHCTVRIDRTLFDAVVEGRLNALAGMLRGDLLVEGDPELLVLTQRLFPGPPDARGSRPVAAEGSAS